MEIPTHFWLRITKTNNEFPTSFADFSARLGNLRRNKVSVTPFVGYDDSTKKHGIRWQLYGEYKKLKKKEEAPNV